MELSLADAMGRIVAVYSPDKPWATMVRDAAATFLDLLATRPDFARMALVEAPSSGGRAFELYASGKRVLQSLLERGRDDPIEEQGIPSSAGRAALAAAESLIVGQILAGNTERLPELLPDIVYIITVPYLGQDEALRQSREAEKSLRPRRAAERGAAGARGRNGSAGGRRGGGTACRPRSSPAPSASGCWRRRCEVVAEKGYGATTVADLTSEAGISRTTFYELFDDKEACFLAAYDNAVDALVRRIAGAYEAEERWPDRARAGLAALLEALAAEPEQARLALVDVGAAGPAAQRRFRAAVQRLTPLLRRGARLRPGRPRPARQHLADGGRRGGRADLRRARRGTSGLASELAFRPAFCHAGSVSRPRCGSQGGGRRE